MSSNTLPMPIAQRTNNRHAFHSTQQQMPQPQQTPPSSLDPVHTKLPPMIYPYVNPTTQYTLTKTTDHYLPSTSTTTTQWRFKKPVTVTRSPALNLKTVAEHVKSYLLEDVRGVRAKNDLYNHMKEKFSHISAHLVRAKVFDVLRVMEGIGALEMLPEVIRWKQTEAASVIDPNWEWDTQFEKTERLVQSPIRPRSPPRQQQPVQKSNDSKKRVRFDDSSREKEEFMELLWDVPAEGEIDTWSSLFMDDFNF